VIPSAHEASAFLDGLLTDLYRRSAIGSASAAPSLIPIIDDPALARQVLARPDIFVKNYDFLDDMARGRFSANGEEWRQRASLTRSWYLAAHKTMDAEQVRAIYARHLSDGYELDADTLFTRFGAASVEVFSRAIGLPCALPWPADLVSHMRALLKVRQWIDWNGCAEGSLRQVQEQQRAMTAQLRALWHASGTARMLMDELEMRGMPIAGFDAAQELIQIILAASEATASSLLWAVEALSQQAAMQQQLAGDPAGLERFIAEVLRLFPPIPYLTRRCVANHEFAGAKWSAGQVLSISIVGIQRHPGHWSHPWQFDAARPEFDTGSAPFAYMPFSRGERVCAGMRLAMLELRGGLEALLGLRRCVAGPTPTRFAYGLSSYPRTSLRAVRIDAPAPFCPTA
jgi:cytochrome P450